MTYFVARTGFDATQFDISFYFNPAPSGYGISSPTSPVSTLTYPDVFDVRQQIGSIEYALLVYGQNFTRDMSGIVTGGFAGEIVAATIDVVTGAPSVSYAMWDFFANAGALVAIALTADTSDDLASLPLFFATSDQIRLSRFNDTFNAYDGADSIVGGGGNDSLNGGLGDDTINGGDGKDTVWFDDVLNATVRLGVTSAQDTGYGLDRMSGFENASGGSGNDSFWGTAGANKLVGNMGNDTLRGGTGSDTIEGGLGIDRLYGGVDAAKDVFLFREPNETGTGPGNRDVIFNFKSGTDKISLRYVDSDISDIANEDFAWGNKTSTANGIWYQDIGANLLVSADVDGDAIADFEFEIAGINSLRASDFIL